jgi:hypothetical protein
MPQRDIPLGSRCRNAAEESEKRAVAHGRWSSSRVGTGMEGWGPGRVGSVWDQKWVVSMRGYIYILWVYAIGWFDEGYATG